MSFNIAIDGPAGAGKSSIAKRIAKEIKFIYVDTGAMYRAMALYFIKQNISFEDESKIAEACESVDITISYKDGEQQVLLNGDNVTHLIRTEEVGNKASVSSKYSSVRSKLTQLQKELADKENVIMDGRDIGTTVLPNANLKIYLTASSKVRAQRRYLELKEKGISCDINKIENDIVSRDKQDMNREISPLKQADDAILVDSSNMTIDEVVYTIINLYRERA